MGNIAFENWKRHQDQARGETEQWFIDALRENQEIRAREKMKQELKAELLKELEIEIRVKAADNIRDEILKALSALR